MKSCIVELTNKIIALIHYLLTHFSLSLYLDCQELAPYIWQCITKQCNGAIVRFSDNCS